MKLIRIQSRLCFDIGLTMINLTSLISGEENVPWLKVDSWGMNLDCQGMLTSWFCLSVLTGIGGGGPRKWFGSCGTGRILNGLRNPWNHVYIPCRLKVLVNVKVWNLNEDTKALCDLCDDVFHLLFHFAQASCSIWGYFLTFLPACATCDTCCCVCPMSTDAITCLLLPPYLPTSHFDRHTKLCTPSTMHINLCTVHTKLKQLYATLNHTTVWYNLPQPTVIWYSLQLRVLMHPTSDMAL